MDAVQPRVQAPRLVGRGEVFEVKALVSHPMETGLRRDAEGRPIPRDIVKRFTCLYDGEVVFCADLHEAVAANPFLSFHVRATGTGMLRFVWDADGGSLVSLESAITVVG